MRPIRQTARWLRLAVAALFAVSAMEQIPAMGVAHAMKPMPQIKATIIDHHHQHGGHSDHSAAVADIAHDGALCFAMGCCLALAAIALDAPGASSVLLAVMTITSVRTMLPVSLDPADPPPRLQV